MKRKRLATLLLGCLLLTACSKDEPTPPRPDIEPTATYDWMAGESPIPVDRVGSHHLSGNKENYAISPNGAYFIEFTGGEGASYIRYVDHGSNKLIPLCGRLDCAHDDENCNAYLYQGHNISYYKGYLYAVTGRFDPRNESKLIRMEPDGSRHEVLLDLLGFAMDNGYHYAEGAVIVNGYFYFNTVLMTGSDHILDQQTALFCIDLDDPALEPRPCDYSGLLYSMGEGKCICVAMKDKYAAQEDWAYDMWLYDQKTDQRTYLIDQLPRYSFYTEERAYYFRDGLVCSLDYATQTEQVLIDTGLEDAFIVLLPDSLLLVTNQPIEPDDEASKKGIVLYVYNWNYELVDAVEVEINYSDRPSEVFFMETAERIILTTGYWYRSTAQYYINKSELGTGNVELHKFERM